MQIGNSRTSKTNPFRRTSLVACTTRASPVVSADPLSVLISRRGFSLSDLLHQGNEQIRGRKNEKLWINRKTGKDCLNNAMQNAPIADSARPAIRRLSFALSSVCRMPSRPLRAIAIFTAINNEGNLQTCSLTDSRSALWFALSHPNQSWHQRQHVWLTKCWSPKRPWNGKLQY